MSERGWSPEKPMPDRKEVIDKAALLLNEFDLTFHDLENKKVSVDLSNNEREALVAVAGEKRFYVRSVNADSLDDKYDYLLDSSLTLTCTPGNVELDHASFEILKQGGEYRGLLNLKYEDLENFQSRESSPSAAFGGLALKIQENLIASAGRGSRARLVYIGDEVAKLTFKREPIRLIARVTK